MSSVTIERTSPVMPHSRMDRCANCHRSFSTSPRFVADQAYCCEACAMRHLCTCFTEVDLADDGVDHIGLAFPMGPVTSPADLAEAVR